jgi:hypothetical protein
VPIRGSATRAWRAAGALLAVAIVACSVGAGSASAIVEPPPYCERTTLHDYLAPLAKLPKLRELPYRRIAEPRFRGVHIGASGPALAVGGGSAGYQFQFDKNPHWNVTVQLAQVNGNGSVRVFMGERRFRSDALAPAIITEPHFSLPERPGIYRTTMVIRSSSGRKIAKFGNYYRLVRPKTNMRFVPQKPTYLPGELVFARLENSGAAFALYGEEFTVEGLQGATWGPVPAAPGPYSTGLQFVGPGTTGHSLVFLVPPGLTPGRYRLSQETVISWPSLHGQHRPHLYAEFEVLAPTL